LDQAQVALYYNNFYFDANDYTSPVKRYIDDKIWFKIMPRVRNDADIFVRRNSFSLQDNYIQITGEEEGSFISISGQRETIDDYEDGDQKMVRIYFRVDPIVDQYERKIYSGGDLLAQVGGVFSFLQGIGAVLVVIFSERLLVAALAGKLYQVYDEKRDIDGNIDDPDDPSGSLDQTMRAFKSNKSRSKILPAEDKELDDEESAFYQDNPIRNLFKSTLYCKNKADKIVEKLRDGKDLDEVD